MSAYAISSMPSEFWHLFRGLVLTFLPEVVRTPHFVRSFPDSFDWIEAFEESDFATLYDPKSCAYTNSAIRAALVSEALLSYSLSSFSQ